MGAQSQRIGDAIRAELATVVKALILEIDANLRADPAEGGTPVDTGHARANWIPSIGAPHSSEVDGTGAHESAIAAMLGYKLEDGAAFESNSAPYINALNYGHSKQRPRMFVEDCVDRAVVTIQQRYAGKVDVSGLNAMRSAIALSKSIAAAYH